MPENQNLREQDIGDEHDGSLKRVTCCLCIPIVIGVWTIAGLSTAWSTYKLVLTTIVLWTLYNLGFDNIYGLEYVWIKLAFGLMPLAFSIALFLGLHYRIPKAMKAWIIYSICLCVLGTMGIAFILAGLIPTLEENNRQPQVLVRLKSIISARIVVLLELCCIWVVYKYARIAEKMRRDVGKVYTPFANQDANNDVCLQLENVVR